MRHIAVRFRRFGTCGSLEKTVQERAMSGGVAVGGQGENCCSARWVGRIFDISSLNFHFMSV